MKLPEAITSLQLMDHRPRGFRAVLVALRNREVRVYKEKYLVNTIKLEVSPPPLTLSHTHRLILVPFEMVSSVWVSLYRP